MPIVDIAQNKFDAPLGRPEGFAVTPGEAEINREPAPASKGSWLQSTSISDALGAAFRQDNTVGSYLSQNRVTGQDDGLNPWDSIKGTKYEPHFASFADVRDQRSLDNVKRQIDQETEDKKLLESAPWYESLPAQLIAGGLDLPSLIPGGAFVRGAKGGFSVARSAANVGAAAGLSSAVQEAALHGTQETRTGGESAQNIGASVFLGGLLGAGGAKLLSHGEWSKGVQALDHDTAGVSVAADARPVFDDVYAQLKATGMADEQARVNASVFAARTAARAERLGGGASPMDVYKADPLEIRAGENGAAEGVGVNPGATPEAQAAQSFEQRDKAPAFYSAVERAVTGAKQERSSADQWLGTLRNTAGVKPEEMQWLGLEGWLKSQGKSVTKQEISDYIRANQIEIKEVTKGGDATQEQAFALAKEHGWKSWDEIDEKTQAKYMERASREGGGTPTKFSSYTLPGGENYREMLLTLPERAKMPDFAAAQARWKELDDKLIREGLSPAELAEKNKLLDDAFDVKSGQKDYRSSHFDEPNILAHVRFNDRVIDGKKTLFIEEVQSDWHQAGKRKGYRPEQEKALAALVEQRDGLMKEASTLSASDARYKEIYSQLPKLQEEINGIGSGGVGVPDAPFKTTWPELSLKRMLRYAADNGYEKIAWTNGETQAARYDLSQQIKEIEYVKNGDGTYRLGIADKDGEPIRSVPGGVDVNRMTLPQIEETVGKEIAEKISNGEGKQYRGHDGHTLEGVDLKVGGEGMKGFYDQILPATVNKLVKKYGGKVAANEIETNKSGWHITPPAHTVSGKWMVKSDDYNSKGLMFDTEAEAKAALAERVEKQPVHSVNITPELRNAATEKGFPLFQGDAAAEPRGKITVLNDNSAVIELFKNADQSTFMHEAGHLWLGEMVRDAAKSKGIAGDVDKILKWFGVDDASNIGLKQHEQFARGFEEYLREGKAPSAGLAKAFESFKQWLTTIYKSLAQLGPDHVAINDDIRGVMDRMLATDREIAARDAGSVMGGFNSVGAAANTSASLEDNSIAGAMAGGVAAATQRLNPALRALHSKSAAYRDIALKLFENALYLKKNDAGTASEPAVETFMKAWNGGLAKSVEATNDAFRDYIKSGVANPMKAGEFREAVGKAMRRGDEDANPFLAKVAKEWRSQVFDPLKKEAIDAGLLPKDVSVETAQSYFSRMWNQNKLIAQEGRFKSIVQDWVNNESPKWAEQYDKGVERRLAPVHREIDDLEMEKLRRSEELKQRQNGEPIDTSEMSEGDIRQALRIVNGGATKPKGVKTLSQFVLESGGLVDDAGELAHRGITNKARPAFIKKDRRSASGKGGGWTLDDMARHAWENDYFPEHSNRPSIDEFVEALNDDFHKVRAVLKHGDKDAYKLNELIAQLEADLHRAGVGGEGKARFSTSEEMKGAVERVYKALDAEADRKIAGLKDRLSERAADARAERESRFIGDPKELSRGIADEVFNSLVGRAGEGVRPDMITVKARGPLKERTFNIPDHLVEDFLEHDVTEVGRRYTRTMGADVELARKFGSVDLKDQIAKVREDYAGLRANAKTEAERLALGKRETSDIGDLEAMRDMLRGTDPSNGKVEQNFKRIIRSVNHVNYLRSMGEVALASLSETVRPAMVHGLMPYMQTIGHLATNLKGIKLSVAEAKQAGNIIDGVLGHRLATLADINDPYASRGPIEAFLENMTNFASKWNGIGMLTDMQKSIASVMTQDRILKNAGSYAEAKPVEKRYLAYMGIDQSMAERIAAQFAAHGEDANGVKVANTEKWTDDVARRTYRAAINKDLDSIITTKGVADTPLFANTPTGRAMLQFKSFALASHQRVLLRGLQESPTRFLGGLIAMSSIGMLATWLKAVSGNRTEKLQDFAKNPGWWISEGIDKAGIFAVPMELANTFEKATGLNAIKTPMKAFDEGSAISQKNQNRSLMGSIAGPSAGLVDDVSSVLGVPNQLYKGEEVTKGQKNAAERLLPFNSYLGVRQLLRYVVNPQNN